MSTATVSIPHALIINDECTDLLGEHNVISAHGVDLFWKPHSIPYYPDVPFSLQTLKECAKENRNREADWYLVYVNGFSISRQRAIRGSDPKVLPCFDLTDRDKNSIPDWEDCEAKWGYRLLDFQPRFMSMDWFRQEEAIAKLGKNYVRAEEQVVTEAAFSIFMMTREKPKPLLSQVFHWGRRGTFTSERACVGCFGDGRMTVCNYYRKDSPARVGVVLERLEPKA